jgi:hypothetical protein
MMKKVVLVLALGGLLYGLRPARADVGGLSAEADVRVDGVLVRRVRDPSNGVVCYVASSYAYAVAPHGNTLAVACVKP